MSDSLQKPALAPTAAQWRVEGIFEAMKRLPAAVCPLRHIFTPGLYTREIFMPKGTLIVSRIHKTEHPFVISKGKVSVWIEGIGVVTLQAPHTGITRPGTRRIVYIHEDCIWTTFHPTEETDPEKIVETITELRLAGGDQVHEVAIKELTAALGGVL